MKSRMMRIAGIRVSMVVLFSVNDSGRCAVIRA
jgi:hypothetical protein